MLGVLPESRPTRNRSTGGTVVSVLAHAALIATAVAATATADPAPHSSPEQVTVVYTTPVSDPEPSRRVIPLDCAWWDEGANIPPKGTLSVSVNPKSGLKVLTPPKPTPTK